MLVLTRKNGQKIIINDNIEITILDSRFDSCKLAIEAPKEVKIYREEVYKQIEFSNRMSHATSVEALENISLLAADITPVKSENVILKKSKKNEE